ncbi:hypothetical protein BG262_02760 [Floricoccus penangensis]|uniref:Uncharacterized protein n=1 Tax=Floricoccus penangensis TaxID=1859475 RepID=A0A9Q5JGX7_9LACT|nr:hypothetical protein [Floricoccus penangensis]OFI46737.1 hypothetical protein BG262_02760 [Floricoccus penangensis]
MALSKLIKKTEEVIDTSVVYRCKKKSDYKALMKALKEEGYMWSNGEKIFENDEYFCENICIYLEKDKGIARSDYEYGLKNYNDKIVRFKAPKKMYVLKNKEDVYYIKTTCWDSGQDLNWMINSNKEDSPRFTKKTAKELKRVLKCQMEEA